MSKRRELESRREEQQKKQWIQIAVIIGVIAIVVIGGAVVLSAVSGGQQGAGNASLPPVKTSVKAIPPNADPTTIAWGPADAPIKVEEFLDYQCPACGSYARNFEGGVIDAFAGSGKVRYEVKFMPFLEDRVSGRESRDAAQSVMCAVEQNKGWQMHNTLFANQLITGEENIGNYSKARLKEMAATIPEMDTAAFGTCLDSNKHEQAVRDIRAAGEARGVQSTPSFFINGTLNPNVRSADDFRQAFQQAAPQVTFP
jgi:protein-disulfide isomerase